MLSSKNICSKNEECPSFCCLKGACDQPSFCVLGLKENGDSCEFAYECMSRCCQEKCGTDCPIKTIEHYELLSQLHQNGTSVDNDGMDRSMTEQDWVVILGSSFLVFLIAVVCIYIV